MYNNIFGMFSANTLVFLAGIVWLPLGQVTAPPALARTPMEQAARPKGAQVEIEEGGQKLVLFLPGTALRNESARVVLHFHGPSWLAIQAHAARGLQDPLLALHFGSGSSVYARVMADPERLGRWLERIRIELVQAGWPAEVRINAVDVTSFSAGYGAVRELVKQPASFRLLRHVVLADSLYGSLTPGLEIRVPLAEHVEVWKPLVEAAARGEKTFLVTCSEVPTPTYASSSEMAAALAALVGGNLQSVPSSAGDYPLRARFDKGRFHVWSYEGDDGPAHMAHLHELTKLWRAMERARAP
jgi:hypothetical protein